MTHPDITAQEERVTLVLHELFGNHSLGKPIMELVNAAIDRQREIYSPSGDDPNWRQKITLQAMAQIGAGIQLISRGASLTGTLVNIDCYAKGEDPNALFARVFVRELAPFIIDAIEYDFNSEQLRSTRKKVRNASPTTASKGEPL